MVPSRPSVSRDRPAASSVASRWTLAETTFHAIAPKSRAVLATTRSEETARRLPSEELFIRIRPLSAHEGDAICWFRPEQPPPGNLSAKWLKARGCGFLLVEIAESGTVRA